eukprot:755677-Hanusia_phi.AAC.6
MEQGKLQTLGCSELRDRLHGVLATSREEPAASAASGPGAGAPPSYAGGRRGEMKALDQPQRQLVLLLLATNELFPRGSRFPTSVSGPSSLDARSNVGLFRATSLPRRQHGHAKFDRAVREEGRNKTHPRHTNLFASCARVFSQDALLEEERRVGRGANTPVGNGREEQGDERETRDARRERIGRGEEEGEVGRGDGEQVGEAEGYGRGCGGAKLPASVSMESQTSNEAVVRIAMANPFQYGSNPGPAADPGPDPKLALSERPETAT